MDTSYFPNDHWIPVGDRHFITCGMVYFHGNSITSCPCVFLRDNHGYTPVYKGPHPDIVKSNMLVYLSIVDISKANVFQLLKTRNWHRDPEGDAATLKALKDGMDDSLAGRVTPGNFREYAKE